MSQYYVYLLASGKYGTFTKKYKVRQLVYYEALGDVYEAILREKQIKK